MQKTLSTYFILDPRKLHTGDKLHNWGGIAEIVTLGTNPSDCVKYIQSGRNRQTLQERHLHVFRAMQTFGYKPDQPHSRVILAESYDWGVLHIMPNWVHFIPRRTIRHEQGILLMQDVAPITDYSE